METNVVKVKSWDLDMWMPSGGNYIKYTHGFSRKERVCGERAWPFHELPIKKRIFANMESDSIFANIFHSTWGDICNSIFGILPTSWHG